ncbi:hypothetical protein [Archangium lansingense]|uniref:Uncharacterized protein n=1 Tax=Archangium lansingense TaxID=2995310 RepID=A0ABT4AI32_9BACT|nr:hypothetical protein [Archangium lansinium]MCY1081348.1 hypothetical protein [Archangium lansinium]
MHTHEEAPRTLAATTPQGHTLILRRFDSAEEGPSYQLSEYWNYLTAAPRHRRPPAGLPESFPSLDSALQSAWEHWRIPPEAFGDIHLGRRVTLDFIEALRSNALGPLALGMSSRALVEHLGMPESVHRVSKGVVCWFYGSVQLLFIDDALYSLEIDRGAGDFTSLRFEGWFLERTTTRAGLETELTRHGVPYAQETRMDLPVIRVPLTRTGAGFLFDFHPWDDTLHALYWKHGE